MRKASVAKVSAGVTKNAPVSAPKEGSTTQFSKEFAVTTKKSTVAKRRRKKILTKSPKTPRESANRKKPVKRASRANPTRVVAATVVTNPLNKDTVTMVKPSILLMQPPRKQSKKRKHTPRLSTPTRAKVKSGLSVSSKSSELVRKASVKLTITSKNKRKVTSASAKKTHLLETPVAKKYKKATIVEIETQPTQKKSSKKNHEPFGTVKTEGDQSNNSGTCKGIQLNIVNGQATENHQRKEKKSIKFNAVSPEEGH